MTFTHALADIAEATLAALASATARGVPGFWPVALAALAAAGLGVGLLRLRHTRRAGYRPSPVMTVPRLTGASAGAALVLGALGWAAEAFSTWAAHPAGGVQQAGSIPGLLPRAALAAAAGWLAIPAGALAGVAAGTLSVLLPVSLIAVAVLAGAYPVALTAGKVTDRRRDTRVLVRAALVLLTYHSVVVLVLAIGARAASGLPAGEHVIAGVLVLLAALVGPLFAVSRLITGGWWRPGGGGRGPRRWPVPPDPTEASPLPSDVPAGEPVPAGAPGCPDPADPPRDELAPVGDRDGYLGVRE